MKPLSLLLGVCLVLSFSGCAEEHFVNEKEAVKQPSDLLSDQEVKTFLKIVSRLSDRHPPGFAALTEPLEVSDKPDQLMLECKAQFQRQFDPRRQGKIWLQNPEVRQAAAKSKWSTVQLAGVMRNLSCAISRSQMNETQNPDILQKKAIREVARLKREIEKIDAIPAKKLTKQMTQKRMEAAMQLGKTVALREYLGVMKSVPQENLELVKKFEHQLTPLVDSEGVKGLEELSLIGDSSAD